MSQKASGEADSSTDNSDKELAECPTCGELYKSGRGVSSHHIQAHGESIAYAQNNCKQCGEEYQVKPHAKEKSNFCSNECKNEWQKTAYSGENNPSYNGGKAAINCDYCSERFMVWESIKDKSRFCSRECKSNYQEEEWSKEDHPSWKGGLVSVSCNHCGEHYKEKQCRVERTSFCSQKCHDEYRSEHGTMSGENHPRWNGGYSSHRGYNWKEQRTKALKRDGHTCQYCGSHEDELNNSLQVHHIVPYRKFDSDEKANDLENLISLCVDNGCHQKWEGIPLKPQFD